MQILQKGGSGIIKQIGDYTINTKDVLGQGSFGIVYKCTDKSQVTWAVKQISKSLVKDKKDYLEKFLRQEINVQQQMRSQNVVRLKEFLLTENNYYLILDYCDGGNLKQLLKKEQIMPEQKAKDVMIQLIKGLKEMNERSVVHRDIKPENILIANSPNGNIYKIGDFGFARNMSNDDLIKTQVGTPLYMDPQILLGKPYDNKCDIWSVGIIFYEMLYGCTPWPKVTSQVNLIEKIKSIPIKFDESTPISEKAKNLIIKMLEKDPVKRISYSELLEDSYFNVIKDQNIKENQNYKQNTVTKQIDIKIPQNLIDKDSNMENITKVYQLLDFSKKNFESFNRKMYNLDSGCLDIVLFQKFVEDYLGQGDYSQLFNFVLKISLDFNIKKSPQNQQKVLIEDMILLFKQCDKSFEQCIQEYLISQNVPSLNANKVKSQQNKQNLSLQKENSTSSKEQQQFQENPKQQTKDNLIQATQQQNIRDHCDLFTNQTVPTQVKVQQPITLFKQEPSKQTIIDNCTSIQTLNKNEQDNKLINQFKQFENQNFKYLKQQEEQIKQPIIQTRQYQQQKMQNDNFSKNNQFGLEQSEDLRKFFDLQKNAEMVVQNNFSTETQQQMTFSGSFFKFPDGFDNNKNLSNQNNQQNYLYQENKQLDPFDNIPDPFCDFQNVKKIDHHRRFSEQTNALPFQAQIQLTSNTTKDLLQNAQNSQDFRKFEDPQTKSSNNTYLQQIPQFQPLLDINKENSQQQLNQNKFVQNQTQFFKNISIGQQSTQTHISIESQGQGWDKSSSNENCENKYQFKFSNNSNNYNNHQIYYNNINETSQNNNNNNNNKFMNDMSQKQDSIIETKEQNNNNLINFNNQQYNLLNFSPAENLIQNKQKSYNPFDSPLSSSAASIGDERVTTEKFFLDISPNKPKENQIEINDQVSNNDTNIDHIQKKLIQNPLSFSPHSNNISSNNQNENNLNTQQNSIQTGISYIFFN